MLCATAAWHFLTSEPQKSGPPRRCFAHFDLQMCFTPQRRGIFRHLNFKKVVRAPHAFNILTYKCASRHSGVQFFSSLLNNYLRTRRFSEPTFRTCGTTNHWKTQGFATFLTFRACVSSFFWLLYSAFQLSILSEVRLLDFLQWSSRVLCQAILQSNPLVWFGVSMIAQLTSSA